MLSIIYPLPHAIISHRYTVSLIIVGLAIGLVSGHVESFQKYTNLSRMDPHLILYIFMPTLIFESAFAMDVHTFKKMTSQIVLLAFPGMLMGAVLTAVMSNFMFSYEWTIWESLLFGTIMSATDPVAVVALLKELGVSRQIQTIMEGESLLNDGTAIVMFTILLEVLKGEHYTAGKVVVTFIRVAIGGPVFGWIMGKLMVGCLSKVFNDAMVEITITLSSSFITFYVAEAFLGVSGVLAVVALGLEAKTHEAYISPEVEVYMHQFWEMMAYLGNTVIFLLVGVVISERAFTHVGPQDWFYLIALYFGLTVIRSIVMILFFPLLARLGYGIKWETVCVMTWGGLRGAVGLALALVVEHEHLENSEYGSKVLFHTAGIVVLTLLVNATTIGNLLSLLKLSEISTTKQLAMAHTVLQLEAAANRTINIQKEDRFLSDAVWAVVKENCKIVDPYLKKDILTEPSARSKSGSNAVGPAASNSGGITSTTKDAEGGDCSHDESESTDGRNNHSSNGSYDTDLVHESDSSYTDDGNNADTVNSDKLCCPECNHSMPVHLRPDELTEMINDVRIRFLKATQRSFWRQYEHGMLSRDAVRVLTNAADHAIDTKDAIVTAEELSSTFSIPKTTLRIRKAIEYFMRTTIVKVISAPPNRFGHLCWKVATHPAFDWTITVIVTINMILVAIELGLIGSAPRDAYSMVNPTDDLMSNAFGIMNGVFLGIYTIEAMIKISGLRWDYFRSYWNLFDLFIWLMSVVDVTIEFSAKEGNSSGNGFDPQIIRMVKWLKVMRSLRGIRLFRKLLPYMRDTVDRWINNRLWNAYDIGKAFVVATDEAHVLLPQLFEQHENIVRRLLDVAGAERIQMIKTLADIQQNHPKIVSSIKTRQASRSILNKARDTIRELKEDGIMDEQDANLLRHICEKKMKKLETTPPCLDPPEPRFFLRSLTWLEGIENVDEVIDMLCQNATLQKHLPGYKVGEVGDASDGIYLVVSGMIRINFKIGDYEYSNFVGAGQVIGEMGVLTGAPRSAAMTCDSITQVFFICKDDLFRALESRPALHEQLWRVCGVRAAVTSLAALPLYQAWPSHKLKHHCETAELFTGEPNSVWNLDDRVSDAVLLTGLAVCVYTGFEIKPLAAVPRGVRTLVFSKKSQFLLIPANNTVNLGDLPTTIDEVRGLQARTSHFARNRQLSYRSKVPYSGSLLRPGNLCAKVAEPSQSRLQSSLSGRTDESAPNASVSPSSRTMATDYRHSVDDISRNVGSTPISVDTMRPDGDVSERIGKGVGAGIPTGNRRSKKETRDPWKTFGDVATVTDHPSANPRSVPSIQRYHPVRVKVVSSTSSVGSDSE